ncbi:hypothetical protein BN12_1220018 [Nostocoides japonicum T1-X7]|uniref:3-methyladenine DNA glycosylase n=2 Tax=Nostocoides japonicum TaxID=99481 RepID=A0A077LUM3_9MICO|nr:hypothetical protein BN12_1220018 [Tetrasphaera japonica T1-X7]
MAEPRLERADPAAVDVHRIRTGPRVGVSGPGGDGTAYPWRFWLDGEPTVSAYRPGVVRRGRGRDGRADATGDGAGWARHTVVCRVSPDDEGNRGP